MSGRERIKRKITINYSGVGQQGIREFDGFVEYHCHEIDGSETILIRTERRDSVREFLENEITGQD